MGNYQDLRFRQYRVIFLCERIARCASPAVYTEYHLCASYICGLGVTLPLPITPALDCRKTTLYCLNYSDHKSRLLWYHYSGQAIHNIPLFIKFACRKVSVMIECEPGPVTEASIFILLLHPDRVERKIVICGKPKRVEMDVC